MPTSDRLSIRTKILEASFSIYACLILVSMAAMNIGAFLLGLNLLYELFKDYQQCRNQVTSIKVNKLYLNGRIKAESIYLISSVLLTLACMISLLTAIKYPLGFGGKEVQVHFFKDISKIWYFFWPLFLLQGLRRLPLRSHIRIFHFWIFSFFILSILGMFQFFLGWPRPQLIPPYTHLYHATLFLGHHLSVASIFIFPFFALVDYTYKNWSRLNYRAYYLTGLLVGLITLFLTFSRTLWIALPTGIVIWIIWTLPRKLKILSLTSLIFLGLILTQVPVVHDRLINAMGVNTREELWLANTEFLKLRPFVGVGWRHNQELSGYYLMNKYHLQDVFSGHAHNNVLDVLAGLGIFGLLTWILWNWSVFWILFQKPIIIETNIRRGLLCAWIVFQINGLTQVNFWEAKVQHQLAWVIAWSLL